MYFVENKDEVKNNILIDCKNMMSSFNQNSIEQIAFDIANNMPRVSYTTYMFIWRPKNVRLMYSRLARLNKHLKNLMNIVRIKKFIQKWKHETWKPGSFGYKLAFKDFNRLII